MAFSPIIAIIGWSLTLLSGAMMVPILFALLSGSLAVASSFFLSAVITVFLGVAFILSSRTDNVDLGRREAFLTATLTWITIPVFAALPIFLTNSAPTFIDSYFEALSGFATNGASVLENLAQQDRAILLWRALVQWLGGFATILFAATLASAFGIYGQIPLQTAIAKSSRRTPTRRIRFAVLSIFKIYTILTVICVAALWATGMSAFDSLCYAFSTLSTGGFVTHDNIEVLFTNRFTELVLVFFMIIGAVNFSLHWAFFNGDRRSYFYDPEYRYILYLSIFTAVIVFSIITLLSELNIYESLRFSVFNVVSAVTTTGYQIPGPAIGLAEWPLTISILLLFLIVIGGSTGSTAGGIKLMRIVLLIKQAGGEISRLSFPSAVLRLKYGDFPLRRKDIGSAWGFFAIFCSGVILSASILAIYGLDFRSAVTLAITNLANAGPMAIITLNNNIDPTILFTSYAELSDPIKLTLCIAMIVGRLEFFAVLSLFNPAFWRQ